MRIPGTMAKVLIIDDDQQLCEALEEVLSLDGHLVDFCLCGSDALQIMDFNCYELMMVDWELGDITGLELVQHFRKNGGISPIMMITARGDIQSKVDCLEKGADDYLVKPFDMRELRARVRTLLRRPVAMLADELEYMGMKINPQQGTVILVEKELKLRPLEFRLLELLVRHRGTWFSTEDLIARVWSMNSEVTSDSVRGSVKRLRTSLSEIGLAEHLQSVRHRGYRME
jgi:DNA-binding response OmpR family regulator